MKKPPNRQIRLKRIKKELHCLWSQVVRWRDGACVMCGATENLQAHHYFKHKAHSLVLAFNPDNGATLCYVCHLIKVHMRADGQFIAELLNKMANKLGAGTIADLEQIAREKPRTITLEELEEMRDALKATLEGANAENPTHQA